MVRAGVLKIKIVAICLLGLIACEEEIKKKPENKTEIQSRPKVVRPDFNADSAYAFIQKQVDFGPRVPNTEAHVKAGNYLSAKLASYGMKVTEQEAEVIAFNGTKLRIKNIVGALKPELNNRVLLFAHWDSRPFADQDDERQNEPIMAANDGASGVGVLLEIARQLQINKPSIGIDIIFFDAEDYVDGTGGSEYYCLGSQYWGKNPHKMGYSANYGILLDMVGGKGALFPRESNSMDFAAAYVQNVWNIAKDLGHDSYFIPQTIPYVSVDDHVYVSKLAKIPSLDIIQYDPSTRGFAPHWHTHDDNMEVIGKETLQAVGETVLATIMMEGK